MNTLAVSPRSDTNQNAEAAAGLSTFEVTVSQEQAAWLKQAASSVRCDPADLLVAAGFGCFDMLGPRPEQAADCMLAFLGAFVDQRRLVLCDPAPVATGVWADPVTA